MIEFGVFGLNQVVELGSGLDVDRTLCREWYGEHS